MDDAEAHTNYVSALREIRSQTHSGRAQWVGMFLVRTPSRDCVFMRYVICFFFSKTP